MRVEGADEASKWEIIPLLLGRKLESPLDDESIEIKPDIISHYNIESRTIEICTLDSGVGTRNLIFLQPTPQQMVATNQL